MFRDNMPKAIKADGLDCSPLPGRGRQEETVTANREADLVSLVRSIAARLKESKTVLADLASTLEFKPSDAGGMPPPENPAPDLMTLLRETLEDADMVRHRLGLLQQRIGD